MYKKYEEVKMNKRIEDCVRKKKKKKILKEEK